MKLVLLLFTALFSLSAIAAPFTVSSEEVVTREEHLDAFWDLVEREFTPSEIDQLVARATRAKSRSPSPSRPGSPAPAAGGTVTVPPLAKIKAELIVAPSKVIFYSGPGGYQAIARAEGKKRGLKILEDSWRDLNYVKPYEKAKNARDFWKAASLALAEKASGTVYVLLPKNTVAPNFHSGTIWQETEWNALKANRGVKKIIMLHPGESTETVIWPAGATLKAAGKAAKPVAKGKKH